jgi:hypothetical protein
MGMLICSSHVYDHLFTCSAGRGSATSWAPPPAMNMLTCSTHGTALCFCSQRIGDELGTQTKALDALQGRTENTKGRLEDMNTKSQLK